MPVLVPSYKRDRPSSPSHAARAAETNQHTKHPTIATAVVSRTRENGPGNLQPFKHRLPSRGNPHVQITQALPRTRAWGMGAAPPRHGASSSAIIGHHHLRCESARGETNSTNKPKTAGKLGTSGNNVQPKLGTDTRNCTYRLPQSPPIDW
jgi:hypothetical protein